MPESRILVTETQDGGQRIDAFLAGKLPELSRSQVQALISQGKVAVNGRPTKSSYKIAGGEKVSIEYAIEQEKPTLCPEQISIPVLHQDTDIIVVDKPAGMVVHPGAGRRSQTLVNALLYLFPDLAKMEPPDRPGIVHRLDKETSGVLVVARSLRALRGLQQQFKERTVQKQYLGLAWGNIRHAEGRISWAIGRHARRRERISIKTDRPRQAETIYRVRRVYQEFTYLEIQPLTGRMHQIRVHMAAAGHPLVGDSRYGRRSHKGPSPRLFLHAWNLTFTHPGSGQAMEFTAPLPSDLQEVLDQLETRDRLQ